MANPVSGGLKYTVLYFSAYFARENKYRVPHIHVDHARPNSCYMIIKGDCGDLVAPVNLFVNLKLDLLLVIYKNALPQNHA
jgi:hypothetical protein